MSVTVELERGAWHPPHDLLCLSEEEDNRYRPTDLREPLTR